MRHLVLRRLVARRANALQTGWLVAPPGPLPALGLGHRLSRELGVAVRGVAVVLHHHEHHAERAADGATYRFHQPRSIDTFDGAARKPGTRPPRAGQAVATCDLELSLLLGIDDGTRLELDAVRALLPACRYAGGRLETVPDRDVYVHEDELEAAQSLGTGRHLVERLDITGPHAPGRDALDRLLGAIAPPKTHTSKTRTSKTHTSTPEPPAPQVPTESAAAPVAPVDGGGPIDDVDESRAPPEPGDAPDAPAARPWLAPAVLGYARVTELAARRGARGGYDHAFVEPLVGAVEYRSDYEAAPPMWRYLPPDDGLYLATTRP